MAQQVILMNQNQTKETLKTSMVKPMNDQNQNQNQNQNQTKETLKTSMVKPN